MENWVHFSWAEYRNKKSYWQYKCRSRNIKTRFLFHTDLKIYNSCLWGDWDVFHGKHASYVDANGIPFESGRFNGCIINYICKYWRCSRVKSAFGRFVVSPQCADGGKHTVNQSVSWNQWLHFTILSAQRRKSSIRLYNPSTKWNESIFSSPNVAARASTAQTLLYRLVSCRWQLRVLFISAPIICDFACA